jgi:hypothetical protein
MDKLAGVVFLAFALTVCAPMTERENRQATDAAEVAGSIVQSLGWLLWWR